MHVDRACAQHEFVCDLAVRLAAGHEPHDLELATRQAPVLVVRGGAPAQPRLDRPPGLSKVTLTR